MSSLKALNNTDYSVNEASVTGSAFDRVENILGRGDNAVHLPQFSTLHKNKSLVFVKLIMLSANAFSLDKSKILSSAKLWFKIAIYTFLVLTEYPYHLAI